MSDKYDHIRNEITSSNRHPKILKNDIRRFIPGMFVNSINSGDFRHVQNFLFSFLVQQCAFNAEVTFPPLFHTPSKVNISGVQLFSHYLLGWHVMFPDTIFILKDSRIVTASQFSGSRIEMDIEFQLTKVSHIPMELWIPQIDRLILLYQTRNLQDMLYAVHCPIISRSTGVYTGYYNYYQAPQHMFSSNSLDSYITTSDMSNNHMHQRATKRVYNSYNEAYCTTTGTELQESEENVGYKDRVCQRSTTVASSAADKDTVIGSDRLISLSNLPPPITTIPATTTTSTVTTPTITPSATAGFINSTTAVITSSNTSTATSTSRGVSYGDSTISVLSTTSTGNSSGSVSQFYAPPAGTTTAAQAATNNSSTSAPYQLSQALAPAYFQYSGGGTSSAPDKARSTASYTALHSHLPAAEAQDLATATTACSTSAPVNPVGMGMHYPSPVLPTQARIPDRFVDDLHAAAVLLHSPLPLRLVGQYVLYLDESNHIVHITLSAAPVQPSPTT